MGGDCTAQRKRSIQQQERIQTELHLQNNSLHVWEGKRVPSCSLLTASICCAPEEKPHCPILLRKGTAGHGHAHSLWITARPCSHPCLCPCHQSQAKGGNGREVEFSGSRKVFGLPILLCFYLKWWELLVLVDDITGNKRFFFFFLRRKMCQ